MKQISMVKKILILTFTVIISIPVNAQKDPVAKGILDAMSAKYKAIPSFSTNFSYTMEDPEEEINEKFEGRIIVMKNKFKFNMESHEVINNGVTVWTFLKDDNEVTISDFDPEEQEISLSNIFNIYKNGYKYLFLDNESTGANDVIDLVPEDLEKTFYKIRMTIKKGTSDLQSFKIFDKSGSRYLYKIKKFKVDTSITANDFTFDENAYPDVEIIDFR